MNTININGKNYNGKSISIVAGVVTVDGVVQPGSRLQGLVEIRILDGKLENLTTDAAVNCGFVYGSVKAGGSVNCGHVNGSVTAGGSVNCDDIGGSVTAGGLVVGG